MIVAYDLMVIFGLQAICTQDTGQMNKAALEKLFHSQFRLSTEVVTAMWNNLQMKDTAAAQLEAKEKGFKGLLCYLRSLFWL